MRSFLSSVGAVYPHINGLGSNTWGMVFAVGHATDPTWHLIGSVDPRLGVNGPGFKAPANLGQRITGTTDSPMVVDDEANGITVAAQKVAKAPLCTTSSCTLNVGPGDYFTHGSNALDNARHESVCTHCKASRGRIPDSMLIRADYFTRALNAGTGLGHVLEMFWPETDSAAGFRLPMTGAEGGQVGWGAEGQRVGIDPSVNLAARAGCTREALVVARTLQVNGAYIGDNAGGNAWIIKAEQNSAADPVSAGAFASLSQTELAGCISAADFVAYSTPRAVVVGRRPPLVRDHGRPAGQFPSGQVEAQHVLCGRVRGSRPGRLGRPARGRRGVGFDIRRLPLAVRRRYDGHSGGDRAQLGVRVLCVVSFTSCRSGRWR
jgi:hypothetical protein